MCEPIVVQLPEPGAWIGLTRCTIGDVGFHITGRKPCVEGTTHRSQYESQLMIEQGHIYNVFAENRIADAWNLRDSISLIVTRCFYVSAQSWCLQTKWKVEPRADFGRSLAGETYVRQSLLRRQRGPERSSLGKNYILDAYRNFNLGDCEPVSV